MSCYPEPDSHIRDKVKVVLDLLNYSTKLLKLRIKLLIILKILLLKNLMN